MQLVQQETQLPISEVRLNGAPTLDDIQFTRHSKLLPQKNIRALFIGPSASGKTCALMSLIYHKEGISFTNLYLFSNSLNQPKYVELAAVMESLPEIGYFPFPNTESVPSYEEIKPFSTIIFDDISSEANKNQHLRSYFSMGRHKHVDSIFLCQTYSAIPKQLVRDNANVLLIFRQDHLNLKHIFEDHVTPDMKFEKFCELCSFAWNSRAFGCLMINKECNLNDGRYRIGFDNYILL